MDDDIPLTINDALGDEVILHDELMGRVVIRREDGTVRPVTPIETLYQR